ncbi:MAG: DNA-processing protein DprA [Muribaculaceae bacterium]|jgi:DNA processing protein|nr:DNA-processing protein DprA [Muribaculaceae bacterium]
MERADLVYRMAFASVRGMNRALADDLIARLGSEREFFEASETRLRYITSSRSRIYTADYRAARLRDAEAEERFVASHGIKAIYYTDAEYPERLADCDDAPLMLYAVGNTDLNSSRLVAVVGTRHATPYGIDFTNRLVEELAECTDGVVIVSGLAYGIDVAAHRAAVRCGLPTVGVLAHGLNTIYPADHRATAADMVRKGGMLLTEYITSEPVHKGNFVARNRIVAGMADCLVVVESADKGGALITANLAAAYCRDVFAVPGRVTDRYSAGCNRLISANAATLVRSGADLCDAMGWPLKVAEVAETSPELPIVMNSQEELIVKFLDANEDAGISQIVAGTGLAVGPLMSTLIDLEFRGLVLSLPGSRYRKIK